MKRLIDAADIHDEVRKIGLRIADDYRDAQLTVLGVLTGSIVFVADLIRAIDVPLRLGVIQASSYRGRTTEAGSLSIDTNMVPDIRGRDVLIADDIFDTGRTLDKLIRQIQEEQPNSIRSVVLLRKVGRQTVEFEPDYDCFRIPDAFVVGYGLDYNDDYRHLPYIATMEESDL